MASSLTGCGTTDKRSAVEAEPDLDVNAIRLGQSNS